MRNAAPVTQNHLSKPTDLMLQNAIYLRKSVPNISDEHVSCTAPATRHASLHIFCKCPTLAIVFGNATKPSRFAHFWQGAESLAPATQNHIWLSKGVRACGVFNIFTWKMCCAPQRRALFRHLNFLKSSETEVFCTFWLGNVLRATTVRTFSTSQLPKVVWEWCAFYILTWKFVSRHNDVQLFISYLATWLRTAALASLLFDHKPLEKT